MGIWRSQCWSTNTKAELTRCISILVDPSRSLCPRLQQRQFKKPRGFTRATNVVQHSVFGTLCLNRAMESRSIYAFNMFPNILRNFGTHVTCNYILHTYLDTISWTIHPDEQGQKFPWDNEIILHFWEVPMGRRNRIALFSIFCFVQYGPLSLNQAACRGSPCFTVPLNTA